MGEMSRLRALIGGIVVAGLLSTITACGSGGRALPGMGTASARGAAAFDAPVVILTGSSVAGLPIDSDGKTAERELRAMLGKPTRVVEVKRWCSYLGRPGVYPPERRLEWGALSVHLLRDPDLTLEGWEVDADRGKTPARVFLPYEVTLGSTIGDALDTLPNIERYYVASADVTYIGTLNDRKVVWTGDGKARSAPLVNIGTVEHHCTS